ncbi:MAG: carbohydrate kinase, partial [Lentisphaeria bacterium]|nr:carbohydrate kinase [Lentisphaeria bacterium]
MNQSNANPVPEILIFGEILFDLFPDRACCGGAPLNLAVHLTRLGENVGLISAIGNGALGVKAKKILTEQQISRSMVATVKYLTGSVNITLDDAKVPTYHFCGDCAYDHIPLPANLPQEAKMLCFGTLAQRSPESRETLAQIRKMVDAPV